MKYNGLKNDMNTFSLFIFIYETSIKTKSKVDDFKDISAEALYQFKKKIQAKVKFATKEEIALNKNRNNFTLIFTSDGKAQIYNFCRHLRNSFVHALLAKTSNQITIIDKDRRGNETCKGFLNYKLVKDYILQIIKDYEQKNRKDKL